ncbi:MAG: serine hydrolase, partial [Gemmatimonadetes bacterium]|nr:serine hydrolase [Gemmatimonadota bacterium]
MNRRSLLKAGAAAAALPIVASARQLAAIAAPPQVAFGRRDLQQLLAESAESLGIVGAQLAVFDGEAVHEFATGLAIRERNLAVTPDTLFQIGSTTKVFNAAVVMALVDEGTLDLDEPVASYLDGAPLTSDVPPVDMTLRQLLSMSSGLDNGPYTDHGRGDDAL